MNKSEQLGYMTQFPVKKDVASWRQEEIKIHGNELKTVHFTDSKPNMFFLQNPNDVHLLLGITKMPSENSYEMRIEANNSITFGRPVPTTTINFLNPSNKDVTITLFSVYDKFDITVLQNSFFNYSVMRETAFDGIIKGFSNGVSLPSGNNVIGKVEVEELPEGENVIGKVGLTEETEKDIDDLVTTLTAVKAELEEANKGIADFLFYERVDISSAVTVDFGSESFIPDYVNFIANDDDTHPVLVTLTLVNGNSKTFTLTKGDIFGDLKMNVKSITIAPKTSGSSVSWRCMFGKRG